MISIFCQNETLNTIVICQGNINSYPKYDPTGILVYTALVLVEPEKGTLTENIESRKG